VGDVLRGVHRLGAVRALFHDFRVIGDDEREALAVDDMPVERVDQLDLGFRRSPSSVRHNEAYWAITHVDPGHHVERASNFGKREAKTGTWCTRARRVFSLSPRIITTTNPISTPIINTTTAQTCSTFNPLNSPSVDPALNTAPLPSTGMPKPCPSYTVPLARVERHHASSATRLRVTPHLGAPSPSRRSVRLGSTRAHESAPTSVAPCVGWAAARWSAGALGTATVMVKEGTRHRANEPAWSGVGPWRACVL
jgi:hypothetical protein